MALHKLLLDEFYNPSFSLVAIHCRLEDYRVAYLLNKYLNINLVRKSQDLDFRYFAATYSIYEWEDKQQLTTWNLVSNVCQKEEESLQSSGSLFNSGIRIIKTHHLLPEFKKVDYFVKISMDDESFDDKNLVTTLQTIPQLMTSYSIANKHIKSKDNLIF